MLFNDKTVLVTGGTGSFGKAFLSHVLANYSPRKVIVFSRDELKQSEMAQVYPDGPFNVRYLLGDIRSVERLTMAFRDVDFVVHAAALKQVPASRYNPNEFIETNIIGSRNVAMAAIAAGVKKVVALSTDKASAPANLYGATKLCAEAIFSHANVYSKETDFVVTRYGNVLASRGSVIPVWKAQLEAGVPLSITDPSMTRFFLTMNQAIGLVEKAFESGHPGDIIVPKIPSIRIIDLAKAVAGDTFNFKTVGIRPGEKLHEALISKNEPCFDCGDHYRIAETGTAGFEYASDTNPNFLNHEQINALLEAI